MVGRAGKVAYTYRGSAIGLTNLSSGTTKKVKELEDRVVVLEVGTVISVEQDGKVFKLEVIDNKLVVTYEDGV